jgi:hypothetical protein
LSVYQYEMQKQSQKTNQYPANAEIISMALYPFKIKIN